MQRLRSVVRSFTKPLISVMTLFTRQIPIKTAEVLCPRRLEVPGSDGPHCQVGMPSACDGSISCKRSNVTPRREALTTMTFVRNMTSPRQALWKESAHGLPGDLWYSSLFTKEEFCENKDSLLPSCQSLPSRGLFYESNLSIVQSRQIAPLLGPFYRLRSTEITARICNYFHNFLWDVMTRQCHNFNGPVNTLRPRQNGRHFADDMFKWIFWNENVWIPIEISLKFVPKGSINNNPALFQIMAWRRPGDKPLSETMMVSSLTHIYVTRPQWVKIRAWLGDSIPLFNVDVITYSWPKPNAANFSLY